MNHKLSRLSAGKEILCRRRNVFGAVLFFAAAATCAAIFRNFGSRIPSHPKRCQLWGNVEICPLVILPPIEQIPRLQSVPSRNPWFFPNTSVSEVRLVLGQAPLPQALRQSLSEKIEESSEIKGSLIFPSTEDVLALSPEARAWIYNRLSRYKLNRDQVNARRFPTRSVKEWLRGVHVSSSTKTLIELLAYRNGTLLFFADIPLLLQQIKDDHERLKVYKMLNRVPTFQLRISVPKSADVRRIADYWNGGGRERDVLPVLEGLQDNGDRLDLIHLMPSLARRRLYRFSLSDRDQRHDCHWTALNFFNTRPSKEFSRSTGLQDELARNYAVVTAGNRKFGDLVVYLLEDKGIVELVHSAVYICDDIVFTKNGTIWSSPWMFMLMPNMDDYYSFGVPLTKKYLRKKPYPV